MDTDCDHFYPGRANNGSPCGLFCRNHPRMEVHLGIAFWHRLHVDLSGGHRENVKGSQSIEASYNSSGRRIYSRCWNVDSHVPDRVGNHTRGYHVTTSRLHAVHSICCWR